MRLAGLIAQLRQLSVAPLVDRAAQDLSASVVLPELDGRTADIRLSQESTIQSVMSVLDQRAETLRQAAEAVLAMPAPAETTYTPISTADAVIRYAGDFVPSWAGAIAIDLLPAVLVLIMMVVQSRDPGQPRPAAARRAADRRRDARRRRRPRPARTAGAGARAPAARDGREARAPQAPRGARRRDGHHPHPALGSSACRSPSPAC